MADRHRDLAVALGGDLVVGTDGCAGGDRVKRPDPIPERAKCRRCTKLFAYARITKPRSYCEPCVLLEKKDTNAFNSARARAKRLAARMNAWLAHEEFADA